MTSEENELGETDFEISGCIKNDNEMRLFSPSFEKIMIMASKRKNDHPNLVEMDGHFVYYV